MSKRGERRIRTLGKQYGKGHSSQLDYSNLYDRVDFDLLADLFIRKESERFIIWKKEQSNNE